MYRLQGVREIFHVVPVEREKSFSSLDLAPLNSRLNTHTRGRDALLWLATSKLTERRKDGRTNG